MKYNGKVKLAVITAILSFVMICACTKTSDGPQYSPPADHTISKDGYMHKTGLEQPLTNCTACHGDDLKGGAVGVSCFECHGTKW